MHDKEFEVVTALSDGGRYAYLIKRVADSEELWGLKNDDGWVIAGDESDTELFPVWSHPRFAVSCATGAWSCYSPHVIPLKDWLDYWLPGLERDGRMIAVFPVPRLRAVPVSPEQFRADLEEELALYE